MLLLLGIVTKISWGKRSKIRIINMATIKRLILNLITFIFASFLTLKFYVSLYLVYAFGKVPLRVCRSLKKINRDMRVQSSDKEVNQFK